MREMLWLSVFVGGCGGGPPTGHVTGNIGDVSIDAPIDEKSTYVLQRTPVCTESHDDIFGLSYGKGTFVMGFRLEERVVLAEKTHTLPPDAAFESFELTPSSPALASGSLTVSIEGLRGRRAGSFALEFADDTSVSGSFDMPYDAKGDNGDCGGGGGGFGDD